MILYQQVFLLSSKIILVFSYSVQGLVRVKHCGLCGLEFEEHNLPGIVSFQAIANLRKK